MPILKHRGGSIVHETTVPRRPSHRDFRSWSKRMMRIFPQMHTDEESA